MNRSTLNGIIILFLIGVAGVYFVTVQQKQKGGEKTEPLVVKTENEGLEIDIEEDNGSMNITSSAFDNNQTIPQKYTCDGENVNPPLIFSKLPPEAKSLALIVDDPDAPSGIWSHWLVFNISPEVFEIEENSVPEGSVQGENDFGKNVYGGPCPPSGVHRYRFKLFALDTQLDISVNSKQKDVEETIEGHVLAETELVGTYGR